MPDKDIVEQACELLDVPTTAVNFRDAAEPLLRALADEVERLRKEVKGAEAERDAAIAQYENQWSKLP